MLRKISALASILFLATSTNLSAQEFAPFSEPDFDTAAAQEYAPAMPLIGSRRNGVRCENHDQCRSGYCLPGPHPNAAPSSTPGSGTMGWFCTAAHLHCALPSTDGGRFRDTISVGGTVLKCQNPGPGLWNQYIR